MKKWKRLRIGGIIGSLVAILVASTWIFMGMPWRNATAAPLVDSNGVYTIPESSGELGSRRNPFVVLEVVPNEAMAQFGYLVDGQEPIRLFDAMEAEGEDGEILSELLSNYLTISLEDNTVVKQEFISGIAEQEWMNYYWNFQVNANQYGYYERLTEKTGDYDLKLALKTIVNPVSAIEETVYEYTIIAVTAGTGSYQWIGYNYADSSSIEDSSNYLNMVQSDTVLDSNSDQLEKILGFQKDVAVYNAYNGEKINKELFKNYALGLGYKDNDISKGEDSSAYEFIGWYKDSQGVNPYNKSDRISSNITLYAKWKTVYGSGTVHLYDVSFDKNADTDEVIHMPDTIGFINSGDSLVEPDSIPLRSGYLFKGWYHDAECTSKFDFSKAITKHVTVYAGWEELPETNYTISFHGNTGAGNDDTIRNLPADVINVLQNGRTADFTPIEPLSEPERDHYIFAGWYWNSASSNPFIFDKAIPQGVTSSTITLYARWIPASSTTTYKVTFHGNKPTKAISSVTNIPKSMNDLTFGQDVTSTFPETVPYLQGNVVEKLKNYHVKVITVTPKDFNKSENLPLIDRANLIVLNQTCESELQTYWTNYKNTELFSKSQSQYNDTVLNFTDNDLSWVATLRLMHKITGMNNTVMCPVIYDYSIYQSVMSSESNTIKKAVSIATRFSDSTSNVNISNVNGYSSNVYKLYLMTQQFNPVTLHNAYIAASRFDVNGNFNGTAYSNDAKKYWNEFTLLPYSVISSTEWNSSTKTFAANTLEIIGVKRNYSLSSGKSLINNRVFLYQDSNSIVHGFMTPQLASGDHSGMNDYFNPAGGTLPDRYSTAEGIYYMLHNTDLYTNFNTNLNILEIEPSDSFKNTDFWFWYIRRYVPNFTGTYSVVTQNSQEFIGDIDDLNSKYDIVYLGMDNTNLASDFMPKETLIIPANQEVTITNPQIISVDYQKKTIIETTTPKYTVKNSLAGVSDAEKYQIAKGNVVGLTASGNTLTPVVTDKPWLNLKLTHDGLNVSDWNYRYQISNRNNIYYKNLNVISDKYPEISVSFIPYTTSNNNVLYHNNSKVRAVLNDFYYKTEQETVQTETWTNFSRNTQVYAGDVIRYKSDYRYDSYYRYAHVGQKVTSKNTRRGSFHNTRDDIDYYNYSGNDLTNAKLGDLLEFANAGYPIILSKDCFNGSGGIDTSIIDKSSFVYNLLTTLTTDSNYTSSSYKETDTSKDIKFINALNNKNFRLIVSEKPVEYVDRTKAAYASYTDDQVYINGAADGSDSKIDHRNMEFTIKIDTKSTGNYEVRLYIDSNADGKFSETEEKLDSLEIENTLTNKTTRVNRLVGGQSYHIVRQIKDYTGAIPWKLELVDVNNPLIRDEITGQCAIKVATKTSINVLQIISDGMGGSYDPTVYFPTKDEIDIARGKNSNMEITDPGVDKNTYFSNECIKKVNSNSFVTDANIIRNAGWFHYYTKLLSEFDVVFYRLSVTEFSDLASTGRVPGDSKVYLHNGKSTYLKEKNINMLILGYADCYTDITNEAALKLIDSFISAGNTTLFTHDTTSFVNLSSKPAGFSDTYWGYNINKYFRTMLGMDRFGVMTNRGQWNSIESAPDKPYLVNTLQSENKYYTANTSAMGERVLTQGMNNVTVGQNGDRVTSATKVNNGQIVTYPYQIPDNLTVASTHAQYYQLDMESDEIVVWYCLDGSSNFYKTDNDVRNNYYIYNRGNITYSGVGHSGGLSDDERKLFVNTMIAAYTAGTVPTEPVITNRDKSTTGSNTDYLYIDYDATLDVGTALPFGSEIFSYTDGSGKTIYTKRVYFTLKNYSIIRNKKMTAHYYPVLVSSSGGVVTRTVLTEHPLLLDTYDYNSETNTGTLIARDTFSYDQTYSDGTNHRVELTGGVVQSTYEYYVDIPISDDYYNSLLAGNTDLLQNFALDSNSRFEIQVQVVMRYGLDDAENIPLVGIRNAAFIKRGMFTLD